MEKEKEITDELIGKYITGNATPEEAIALHEWMEQADNEQYYRDFESAWNAMNGQKKIRTSDKIPGWNKVAEQLPRQVKIKSFYSNRMFLRAAAALVIILITSAIAFYFSKQSIPPVEQITHKTIEQIELPDQSLVTMSKESKIVYQSEFNGNTRELTLEGEAFFKITPDKNKPFIIHTPSADIKVVGTSFNVISRNGQLEVSVVEGKVLVQSTGKQGAEEKYLEAGSSGTINKSTQSIEIKNSVNVNEMGYATHLFLFKNTSLAEVFRTIENQTPYSITISNKAIENCKLTATFENASVENILSLVAETLDLAVTKDGQTFVLQGRGCP